MDKYWYLEHISCGRKVILQTGENTLGRHSNCKIVLKDYEYLSRNHAKIIVSTENGVSLEQMEALNGVYINNIKLDTKTRALICGDQIGLGVEIDKESTGEVPASYAIFILKQTSITAEDTVLISDDEGEVNDGDAKANAEIPELITDENKDDIRMEQPDVDVCSKSENVKRTIHLPKLPDVKKELLSQASKEIENIFGEPNEELLESVFQINPYVYKQLNNNNLPIACENQICDGDVIELQEDVSCTKVPLPIKIEGNTVGSADYDEDLALSQAVLREMKEEMADALADLSDLESDSQENDDFVSPCTVKSNVANLVDEEEIIIIEDDEDDELFSKVADWSSKLLSQNIMSQVYPLEEEQECSDIENEFVNQILNTTNNDNDQQSQIKTKRSSKALRIESSDSEEDLQLSNLVTSGAGKNISLAEKKTETEDPKLGRCCVRLKSIDVSQLKNVSSKEDNTGPVENRNILEVTLVPKTSKSKEKGSKNQKSTPQNTEAKELRKQKESAPKNTKKSEKETKPQKVETVAQPKPETSPQKNLNTRLRNRSKSCYAELIEEKNMKPMETPKPTTKTSTLSNRKKTHSEQTERGDSINEPPDTTASISLVQPTAKTTFRKRSKTISEQSQVCGDFDMLPKTSDKTFTEKSSTLSPRLLNRSKSCLIERLESPLKPSEETSKKKDQTSRRLTLIDPPNLPLHRNKLRGVSAEKREMDNINAILQKQRSLNYQAEMKRKWYQKPSDTIKETEQNKKLRREQLQKLALKSKQSSSTVNSNDLKRKPSNVPTPSNSNRGEFLTKEMESSIAKKPKLDKVKEMQMEQEKHIVTVKACPKRRLTIGCSSEQKECNESAKNPPSYCSRPPERKEAEMARNQRTCNRVTFANMDRDFQHRLELNKMHKGNRRVRFNDIVQINIIERIEGANRKVENQKDSKKVSLSRYSDRREWAQSKGKLENYTDFIKGNILSWANQWLLLRNPDDVAESDVLMPIPTEFKSYKQYKETIIPLMKVELLTTIEREYKSAHTTYEVSLISFTRENSRNRPRFLLVTRLNMRPKKFDLYTLCSGDSMKETFATLWRMHRVAGNVHELTFDILQMDLSEEMLQSVKIVTVRPVVDNMRVELGAFDAVYQLGRSPLFHRILQPSENVLSFDTKVLTDTRYRGFSKLNKHQIDICLSTWIRLIDDSTPSITLIQGPPGTGKSAVISNLTLQCMYGSTNHTLDRKILICAHSNAAVDNITLYLNHARKCMSHSQFELLRFGILEKMDQKVHELSLDHHLNWERDEKLKRLTGENVESLIEQQLELKMEIAELKERSGKVSYVQQLLESKEKQLRLINGRLTAPLTPREEYELSKKYLQRANIVCTTLSSCVKLATYIDYFDACIIDEATQCTEPWTLLPLQFGVRGLVLVGDTQQLPATVLSQKAIEFGLGNSMFDRIQRNLKHQINKEKGPHFVHTKVFKLSMQYRMHPEICKWPNNYFYENELVNADCTQRLISPIIPYCVINLSFTCDTNDPSSRSISNEEEAEFVAKLLLELDNHMPAHRYRYGLITPYSKQCSVLSKVIPSHMSITPQTVDAYQGQERDVIILSNARTRGVGFLTNYQRLNVSITRPRRCLIICGNFDNLQAVDMWRHLLDDARKRQIYFDLKRSDVADLNRSLISKILVKTIKINVT